MRSSSLFNNDKLNSVNTVNHVTANSGASLSIAKERLDAYRRLMFSFRQSNKFDNALCARLLLEYKRMHEQENAIMMLKSHAYFLNSTSIKESFLKLQEKSMGAVSLLEMATLISDLGASTSEESRKSLIVKIGKLLNTNLLNHQRKTDGTENSTMNLIKKDHIKFCCDELVKCYNARIESISILTEFVKEMLTHSYQKEKSAAVDRTIRPTF